jgi:hypothetical protein
MIRASTDTLIVEMERIVSVDSLMSCQDTDCAVYVRREQFNCRSRAQDTCLAGWQEIVFRERGALYG